MTERLTTTTAAASAAAASAFELELERAAASAEDAPAPAASVAAPADSAAPAAPAATATAAAGASVSSGATTSARWYVIQVRTGRERILCERITRAVAAHNATCAPDDRLRLDECFTPKFHTQKKLHGEWRDIERPLTPGYLIAATDSPARLALLLRPIPELCRILTEADAYVPLNDAERAWAESCTQVGQRVVPMSFAKKVGDTLTVMQGPLKGQEARITKVDRRNSLAHVEIHVGPMTIRTTVGLGILPE